MAKEGALEAASPNVLGRAGTKGWSGGDGRRDTARESIAILSVACKGTATLTGLPACDLRRTIRRLAAKRKP